MKKKIFGIFVCMLLIITVVPAVESLKNDVIHATHSSTLQTSATSNNNEIQKLLASDGTIGDWFGFSVSVYDDTALIGARGDGNGSAYIFIRIGTTWTQQAKISASDGAPNDQFGCSVSISGNTALIGALGDDNNGYDSGSAYVFTRTGTTWTQQAKLRPSEPQFEGYFGESVSLDEDTALIAAPMAYGHGAGSVYVFTRTGTTWTQQQILTASYVFGKSVSLDDNSAIIGAPGEPNSADDAYVFIHTPTGWVQQQCLHVSEPLEINHFGCSVSLSGDTAIIGARGDNDSGDNSGSAYVFTRSDTTWGQEAKLLASDGAAGDEFGNSVSISGNTALIGANYDDDNGDNSGSSYVFIRTGTTWTQKIKLLPSDGAMGDEFGFSVSLDGNTALVGTPRKNNYTGAVYIFYTNQPPNPQAMNGPSWGLINVNYTFCMRHRLRTSEYK